MKGWVPLRRRKMYLRVWTASLMRKGESGMQQVASGQPVRCRVMGHRFAFWAEGEVMTWGCERCPAGGSKRYATTAEAARMASALDVRPTADLGRRAPLIGLLPLRLWHRLRGGS